MFPPHGHRSWLWEKGKVIKAPCRPVTRPSLATRCYGKFAPISCRMGHGNGAGGRGTDAWQIRSTRARYRGVPHGMTGTVEMAFCGEPSISLSLMAR